MEELIKIAQDAFYTPIFMKKNRPAYKLTVILKKDREDKVLDIIFKHTTTIGVRIYPVRRKILSRRSETFKSSLGPVDFKICTYKGEDYPYPEYESLKKIAGEKDISLSKLYNKILREYEEGKMRKTKGLPDPDH